MALAAVLAVAATAGTNRQAAAPPVDVWAIAPVGTPIGDIPMIGAGDRAAARYVNAHGGLGKLHQQIVVKDCNTQATPNGELQCAQQAAADSRAIAVVGAVPLFNGTAFTNTLETARLPNIGPFISSPDQFVNPINFNLYSPNFSQAACAVLAPKASGLKKVGFASINIPLSTDVANAAMTAGKNAGNDVVGIVTFPVTVTDLAPYVRQLQDKGPQMVVLGMQPQLIGPFVSTSLQLGNHWAYCGQDGIVFYQTLVALGSNADNFYFAAAVPEFTDTSYPLLAQFRAQATAEFKAGDKAASLAPTAIPQDSLNAWLDMQAVIQAGAKVKGTITRANFLNALNHTKVTFGNGAKAVLPPVNFARRNPDSKYSRLFNTRLFLKKWDPQAKEFVAVKKVGYVFGDKLVP
jgi:ABC-type branched-subunit amino acid transport system substrate-binding protein